METNKETKNVAISSLFILGAWVGFTIGTIRENVKYNKVIGDLNPKNIHIQYINNDDLHDLIYKTGEIYLQTKEGKFVSYNEVLEKEKHKLDSIYHVKKDSIKNVFENKLEKKVK